MLVVAAVVLAFLVCSPWGAVEIGDGGREAVVTFVSTQHVRRVLYRPFGVVGPDEEKWLATAKWDEMVRDGEVYQPSLPEMADRFPIRVLITTRKSAVTGIVFRYVQVEVVIVAELDNGERWLFLPALPDLRTQRELTLRIPADGRLLQGGFAKLPLTRDD